ncbi:AAA family ATPase [Pseudomonas sp. AA-38]|uniref:AAA family ATPase n=1 Tax=Pseudomonas sp. AA-38 TaxID=3028807 RepID=UPI0023FA45C1|nr:AAA family ATPase [Pseudomonas sp. AA-38]
MSAQPFALPLQAAEPLAQCFDAHWMANLDWQPLDHCAGVSRWRVDDARAGRKWLVVRADAQATRWEQAGLDHEYALAPRLAPDWALLPVARLGCAEGTLLVLDDEAGVPLSTLSQAPLSVPRFLQLALASARALAGLHRAGLVHRNLCPENLILDPQGGVRLTGFCRAAVGDEASLTLPPVACLAYLPPDQAGKPSADLYALGVCFFLWLTGRHPFEAQDVVEWQHRHAAVAAPLPSSLRPGLPGYLDALVSWMLAKQGGARPQQAEQVEATLQRCLQAWREGPSLHRVAPATPRLIGREAELAVLREACQGLLRGQGSVLLLEGEAGIGKTSLVRRMRQEEGEGPLLFASAKCELSRRGRPYETLEALFAELCERLLAEPPEQVEHWRWLLQAQVAAHGTHLVRLIPALAPLLGEVADAGCELLPSEARRYLCGLLQRLLLTLAQPGQPLLLFIDDVQWIDKESSDFLAELPETAFDHLLLILACRPCPEAQAARRLLETCRALEARYRALPLLPLDARGLAEWLEPDAWQASAIPVELAARLQRHGSVSPLFLQQFDALWRERGAIAGDDLDSLLAARLQCLPLATCEVLQVLALLGNQTRLEELAGACSLPLSRVTTCLVPALEAGLVIEHGEALMFVHDSVQEAVHASLSSDQAACLQTWLVDNLMAGLSEFAVGEALTRVAEQALRLQPEALSMEQRLAVIDLLVQAAGQAIDVAAAGLTLAYLRQAESLLIGLDQPQRRDRVNLHLVRGLILDADYAGAEQGIARCLASRLPATQRVELQRLQVETLSLQGRYRAALACAVEALAELGLDFPSEPDQQQAEAAWQALLDELGERPPCLFVTLPPAEEVRVLSVMGLLTALMIPGSFVQPHLMLLASCRIALLALHHGLSATAVQALAWLGVAAAERFEFHGLGFAFAAVARQLAERPEYAASRMSVLLALDQVSVWTQSLPYALECAEQAYRASLSQGAPSFACYANNHIVSDLLVLGAPIERMLQQIDTGLALACNLEFRDAQSILHIQARYIRRLAGDTATRWPIPDKATLQARVEGSDMGPLRFWWWLFEGLLAFLEGDFAVAAQYMDRAWKLTWSAPVHIQQIDLAMFSVLNRAALQGSTGQVQDYAEPLRRLRLWAELNPRYFKDRLALAEAEVARVEGDLLGALRLYEQAIEYAESAGAVHIKGLGHELAARCHGELQLRVSAREHLRRAHAAWRRWGAHTLARQLEQAHGFLSERDGDLQDLPSMAQQVDRLSITRACQALSREIEPDALIESLLANAAMYANAGYVVLVLAEQQHLRVAACGQSDSAGVRVRLAPQEPVEQLLPLLLVRQAMAGGGPLLVEGRYALRRYTDDPYLRQLDTGSVLCLPLLKQREVIGALYLENRLTTGAIDPSRVDLLALLAAQAAISLSHARLYADLLAENQRRRESQGNLRRTQALLALGQEVSRYGTFIWRLRIEPSFWSATLLAELGLSPGAGDDYLQYPAALVHEDDRVRFEQTLAAALEARRGMRLEFRCVSVEATPRYLELLLEPTDLYTLIGVVSDISERRRTEAELHAARSELERTAQAAILGELTASISHEINQPLASILSNAAASVRWLEREQPSVGDALEGLQDILSECRRAAEIIRATRALACQAPGECQPLDPAQMIRQVLAITQAEIDDKHIELSLHLQGGLLVAGDAVQLQQVVRNLLQNAIEAMSVLPTSNRRLRLQCARQGEELLVLVEDSGPGVPEALQGQVFQAFFSTKSSGMGMGLAICRSIISNHGGVLGATLGRNDESLFFFTLPVYRG